MTQETSSTQAEMPYLSVVAASRNDDHGGDPLVRTQIFINNFARQCEKFKLSAELIIVDWNTVPDRPPLAAVLSFPSEVTYCTARVISVPPVLHNRLKYADKLAFFQMIAKNVGIRRAKGEFTLATNIDILFSNELIEYIAKKELNPGKTYRVDRYDIQSGLLPESSLDEAIEYAWTNPVRSNRRLQPENLVQHLYGSELFKRSCVPDSQFRKKADGVSINRDHDVWSICPDPKVEMSHLHTNACGDFTLLSREGWEAIRGYPEFEAFSFNIDSVGLIAAHYQGYEEVSLLPPCVCFHIEHGVGSGWSPEGEKKLFGRLRKSLILSPEWPVLAGLVSEMRSRGASLEFNHAGWGLADFDLPQQAMGDTEAVPDDKLSQLAMQAETHGVSAIQPKYDLDRLTLEHSQIQAETVGRVTGNNLEKVILYIPDSNGGYSEKRSIATDANLSSTTTLSFLVKEFHHKFPLRFDPCQCPGLVRIDSITAFDTQNNKVAWGVEAGKMKKLGVNGTAVWANRVASGAGELKNNLPGARKRVPLYIASTGPDPQLILPPLPANTGFPLLLSVDIKVTPDN